MKKIRIKSTILYFLGLTLMLSLLYISYYYYNLSQKKVIVDEITYSSTEDSTYEVFYSGSRIFSGKSSEEGFIKKYTDEINIHFDYNLDFSNMVNGTEESLVKAYIVVNAPNSESEIYRGDIKYLEAKKTTSYKDSRNYKKTSNIKINYQDYVKEYNDFKEETSIVSTAKIRIELITSSIAQYKTLDKIIKNDTITYEIPLSEITYNITKKTSAKGKRKTIKKYDTNMEKIYQYKSILVLSILIIITTIIIMGIRYQSDEKRKGKYQKKLNKIMKSYDDIIVNVENLPDINQESTIKVTSFEELIDAQTELRLPINLKVTEKKATFMIVKENMGWVYTLEKERKRRKK